MNREPQDFVFNMTKTISLVEAEYNPRDISKRNYSELKENISQNGILQPIIVNTNPSRLLVVVGGHQRLRIAKELGMEYVPTTFVSLDIAREKKMNLSLNKNTGTFNKDILANQFDISELLEVGFSELELGIQSFDLGIKQTYSINLTEDEYKRFTDLLNLIKNKNNYKTEKEAFMFLFHGQSKPPSVRAGNNPNWLKE